MSPKDVKDYISFTGASFGQDVTLPGEIDTGSCSEFCGTRCPENVHVTGKNKAHIDRVDPRYDPLGHLKHDVGIPYTLIGTVGCATIGAAVYKKNRIKGAVYGGAIGTVVGFLVDLVSYYRSANHKFDNSL